MALDRTWYNSLVDDDGSGLTGSVWDKADVDALMDAIDVELGWIDGAWTGFPPPLTAAAGTWTSAGAHGKYRFAGKRTVMVQYSIEASTLSAVTASISLGLPVPAAAGWPGTPSNPGTMYVAGVNEISHVTIPASRTVVEIVRHGGATFPAGGGLYVRGQITYEV